jgi:6-phosphogluconolactonase
MTTESRGANPPKSEIRILPGREELSTAAAQEFVRLAKDTAKEKRLFSVALSGGSTPRGLYALLADEGRSFRSQIRWDRIHLFWGDERHVPPEHPESNYRMVDECLLSTGTVPRQNVHRIHAENLDAAKAAADYAQTLRNFFKLTANEPPRFDLALLGMGADGHTASLFPGTEALEEQRRLVVAQWVGKFRAFRITLTPPALNHADNVIFLVSGGDKAEVLREVLRGAYSPRQYPAQLVRPTRGRLLWLVDQAAAGLL